MVWEAPVQHRRKSLKPGDGCKRRFEPVISDLCKILDIANVG